MVGKEFQSLTDRIAEMDRPSLIEALRGLECDFKMDFDEEFLTEVSIERLRHILLAVCMHAHELPARLAI